MTEQYPTYFRQVYVFRFRLHHTLGNQWSLRVLNCVTAEYRQGKSKPYHDDLRIFIRIAGSEVRVYWLVLLKEIA